MMPKWFWAPAAALLLAGCATSGVTTTTIEVPVPVFCDPPEVPAPAVPADALGPGADMFEHARALWASVERLEGHAAELRAALDACRKHGAPVPPR